MLFRSPAGRTGAQRGMGRAGPKAVPQAGLNQIGTTCNNKGRGGASAANSQLKNNQARQPEYTANSSTRRPGFKQFLYPRFRIKPELDKTNGFRGTVCALARMVLECMN